MVKLLIDLNYKEFQVFIWKFIKGTNGCMIKTIGRPLIIGNTCKMNAWVHLGFPYFFHASLKTWFILEFYQMNLKQIVSKLTY